MSQQLSGIMPWIIQTVLFAAGGIIALVSLHAQFADMKEDFRDLKIQVRDVRENVAEIKGEMHQRIADSR